VEYSIEFEPESLKDWYKLQSTPRERFKKMLAKRIENPRITSSLVSGYDGNVYRLKLSSEGLRLIYLVLDEDQVIYVIAVGKREDLAAYRQARFKLD
jgi:mRNA interferase RelE/StbE